MPDGDKENLVVESGVDLLYYPDEEGDIKARDGDDGWVEFAAVFKEAGKSLSSGDDVLVSIQDAM